MLAAAAFHTSGNTEIVEIDQAHALLSPLLGGGIAPMMFGVALLACGLNATVTATMAGQIVMEGFIAFRISPVLRRLITRVLAIAPAVAVILIYGSQETGKLLILSQVILSFQLPFAIVPLVMFTASRAKMGDMVAPKWLTAVCALVALTIIGLNLNLLSSIILGADPIAPQYCGMQRADDAAQGADGRHRQSPLGASGQRTGPQERAGVERSQRGALLRRVRDPRVRRRPDAGRNRPGQSDRHPDEPSPCQPKPRGIHPRPRGPVRPADGAAEPACVPGSDKQQNHRENR
ncbi:Nramp family divalent metal transporter [Gemmobacter lanyuensis]